MAFGRIAPAEGAGAYEVWVAAIRRWSADPQTDLGGLPTLTGDSFDQGTYDRLIRHVQDAVQTFMDRWSGEFGRATARVATTHDLATELIRLRHLLEPRVRLATLAAWPEQVRDAFTSGLRADLLNMQAEIEAAFARSSAGGRWDRAAADELVAVARRNPLLAVLETTDAAPATSHDATPTAATRSIHPSPGAAKGPRRILTPTPGDDRA